MCYIFYHYYHSYAVLRLQDDGFDELDVDELDEFDDFEGTPTPHLSHPLSLARRAPARARADHHQALT